VQTKEVGRIKGVFLRTSAVLIQIHELSKKALSCYQPCKKKRSKCVEASFW
jgi:hypothetical protein